jgi:TatD family-associated radical SAM protein
MQFSEIKRVMYMDFNGIPRKDPSKVIAYRIGESLYLNITNRCPNHCVFCIRETKKGVGYNLWLEEEPSNEEVIAAIGNPADYQEIVFCGYGEPLLRPDVVVAVSRWLKAHGSKKIRINTNGLAELCLKQPIVPQLSGLIDEISISLNAHDATEYLKLTESPFGEKAFPAVLDFAEKCKMIIPRVILSVVDYPGVDTEKAAIVAKKLRTEFRIRQYQD